MDAAGPWRRRWPSRTRRRSGPARRRQRDEALVLGAAQRLDRHRQLPLGRGPPRGGLLDGRRAAPGRPGSSGREARHRCRRAVRSPIRSAISRPRSESDASAASIAPHASPAPGTKAWSIAADGVDVIGLVGDGSGQGRGVGEAGIGQEGADLQVGVVARLEQAVELEDEPLAEDDRGVRLLDGQAPLVQRPGLEAAAARVSREGTDALLAHRSPPPAQPTGPRRRWAHGRRPPAPGSAPADRRPRSRPRARPACPARSAPGRPR